MPRIGETSVRARRCRTARLRNLVPGVALLVMLTAQGGAVVAEQAQPVGANGPASLPEPAVLPATPEPAATSPDHAVAGTFGQPPAVKSAKDARATSGDVSRSESRPLGKANGVLSSRPIADQTTKNSASALKSAAGADVGNTTGMGSGGAGGVFNAIDPRRNDFTRVLGALAAVVGLILLLRTLLARYAPGVFTRAKTDRPSGVMEILARYPIGRGQQLIVLKFARRVLLLHQAGSSCSTLAEMSDADEVAALLSRLEAGASEKSAAKFRAALESFETEHESAVVRQSRAGAALAATQTEIIDLTRTQVRSIGGPGGFAGLALPGRRALR